jgi:hypothetical protein
MHARLATVAEASADWMDDAARHLREQVLPQLKQLDEFKGFSTSAATRATSSDEVPKIGTLPAVR